MENDSRRLPPVHYRYDIEPWDIIKCYDLCFFSGNVLKYILRAGKKEGNSKISDLMKAKDYLEELIRESSN